jgi:STE24 endopeptidase
VDASRRTRRTNAYFTGLGATRRIVLYDTLKGDLEPGEAVPAGRLDEMETILAHEAGHWMHGDVWKGTALAVAGLGGFFLVLWLVLGRGWGWLPAAALPDGARAAAVVLLVGNLCRLVAVPLENAVTRRMERRADRASLEITRNPGAFIRAEVELARRNVSEIEPGPVTVVLIWTHPPALERIRMAEEFAGAEGGGG